MRYRIGQQASQFISVNGQRGGINQDNFHRSFLLGEGVMKTSNNCARAVVGAVAAKAVRNNDS
ncbi:hypothetical protein D3C76_1733030 [compost metagenome]